MAASKPLTGIELIDCAKANSKELINVVAYRCGYGEDILRFEQELKTSCEEIGVDLNSFYDLQTFAQQSQVDIGIEIAPETSSDL